jgi:hypothetical protein
MRACGFCKAALDWVDGAEATAREQGGNTTEKDTFQCRGCRRFFRHVVHERFSGDTHWWGVKRAATDDWEDLDEALWPR